MSSAANIQQNGWREGGSARSSSSFVKRTMGTVLAHFYRVPYCVPYWNAETYRVLLRCICHGQVIEGPDRARLTESLAEIFSVPEIVTCGSGKVAIEIALRVFEVTKGDEVVVPTFCCTSILSPILAVSAVPVFADVGDHLTLTPATVAAALSPRTRVVIVPHLFGNATDIMGIVSLCHTYQIRVIDDAAQALGATIAKQHLGTFGDAGVVSFGNGKVCFGTGGGVFITRNPEILKRARQIPLAQHAVHDALRNVFSVIIWRRWRRWSLPFKVIIERILGPERTIQTYHRVGMRNIDAAVASTLLDTLEDNLRARRERVALYEKLLGQTTGIQLVHHHPGSACLTQAMIIRHDYAEKIPIPRLVDALRASGYEVNTSYTPLHLHPIYRHYTSRPLVNAERVWNRVIELPCEPSVSLTDVERIATHVRGVLGRS